MVGLCAQNFLARPRACRRGRVHPRLRPRAVADARQLLGGPDARRCCGSCCRRDGRCAGPRLAGRADEAAPLHAGDSARRRTQVIAQGPVAALEIIKNLGTNGGGFFNANGAHPFENPTPLTNVFEMLAIVRRAGRAHEHLRANVRSAASRMAAVWRDGRPVCCRSGGGAHGGRQRPAAPSVATAAPAKHGRQGDAIRHRRGRRSPRS